MSAETELLLYLYDLHLRDKTSLGRFCEALPNNPFWRNVVCCLWEKGYIEGGDANPPVSKGRITEMGIMFLKSQGLI